jgi:acyl-CoA thioesterase
MNKSDLSPEEIVSKMYDNDLFSKWMGIKILHVSKGKCILEMKVKNEMLNGFSIAHGGITYSLGDSCLAFAANSHGIQCMSIETAITHIKKVNENDALIATSKELKIDDRRADYEIQINNQHNENVATFKGTVHRTNKKWE